MRNLFAATAIAALAFGLCASAHAQDKPDKAKPDTAASKDDKTDFAPFPADAHVEQVTHVAGKTLNYTATVGSLPVRDDKGKKIADVVFTAYTLDGVHDPRRPVTFAFNGGPGAASVYMNLGAIGPKHVPFGKAGDSPSDAAVLTDNPGTWLDFTDLVFIDPVGTGFSRSLVDEAESKKHFYGTKQDIEYLSRIIYDWLNKNGRLTSPKYVSGESYGGFRSPRIAHYLQTRMGVGVSGVVMVSPYLDSAAEFDPGLSPLPWVITMPAMAAANLERHGELDAAHMAPVIAYARGDFASDLMKGRTDPAANQRLTAKVSELTGLDPNFVKVSGGRIETQAFLREVFRQQGKLGSRYDSNVTEWDPFPYAPEQRTNDPILDSTIAPTTSAMVDFDTRVVGWKVDAPFHTLSYDVGRMWNDGHDEQVESVTDLREAVALDPKMKVLIAHGWDDLSCPFMASVLIVDQMPTFGDPNQVQVKEYPGGHMFYARPDSQRSFRQDVMAMYGAS
ncbi:S10 family peptidase [Caulobacter sp. S45]|uniref:S10 family peptidase n=1 Tax=Caulobacter sp. S45 TaxID=1641861 RepID=UPI00131CE76C|nr:peptidase S10 [Caulobacter sp. S45]